MANEVGNEIPVEHEVASAQFPSSWTIFTQFYLKQAIICNVLPFISPESGYLLTSPDHNSWVWLSVESRILQMRKGRVEKLVNKSIRKVSNILSPP